MFETVLQGLAPRQIALLRALARKETASVFAANYISDHALGSTGTVQGALRKLTLLDLAENDRETGRWRVTDPVFGVWLARMGH